MRTDELKAIEAAVVALSNAIVEQRDRKRLMEDAQRRHEQTVSETKKAREALIKLMGVGRNIPMKSMRVPDSLATIVVQWHPQPQHDDGKSYGNEQVTVHLTHPDGSETV